MSDFILEYDMLESIAKYSASLGKRAEEYSESLDSKIICGIGNVTGPSSGYLLNAEDSVRDKINTLKQKSDAFYHYSEQILNLLEVAKQMDQEVEDAIAGQRDHSPDHHHSMRLEDWKAKLTALLVAMSLPLLKTIADLLNSMQSLFDSLENTIKHWYKSLGGNHLTNGEFNRIMLFSDMAGLAVAGAGAVCLVNGKIFERINNEGLNYSGLNGYAKGDNVDLKSNILKTYFKMKRAEYEFLTGGMLAIDDNVFSGSLQAISGYDKGLQPDSAAFKLGRFAGDTASLAAGVTAFVAGGLGEIGGVFFDATGLGAIAGVPLTIVSDLVAGAGGAVSLKSAQSLIKDGFSMMSGDGGIRNEEGAKSEIKAGDKTPKGREYANHGAERANERGFDSQKIDSIIDNNYKNRVKEVDKLTGKVAWRYQDKRGNTVITNEWGDKIVTVYSYPSSTNGGNYIP